MKRGILYFQCNLCSEQCWIPMSFLSREHPSCQRCGSTPRLRSIVAMLSRELFGQSMPVRDFPVRRDIAAIGLSDPPALANALAEKFDYRNTFFHTEPRVDVTKLPNEMRSRFDFIVSSEVFEHVLHPVSRAFKNVRRMLKPDGCLVFTVPYYPGGGKTIEHYPRLHDYRVVRRGRAMIIENVTSEGEIEIHRDPVFHGGPGEALEMRVFTERSLLRELRRAGFREVAMMKGSDFDFGVYWKEPWSRPLVARLKKKKHLLKRRRDMFSETIDLADIP